MTDKPNSVEYSPEDREIMRRDFEREVYKRADGEDSSAGEKEGEISGLEPAGQNSHAQKVSPDTATPQCWTRHEKERFEKYIERIPFSGCWIWLASVRKGSRDNLFYGCAWNGSRNVRAHRYAHELYIGPITDGLNVLHRCDVSLCVNPSHLFLGTSADNTMDCARKGRLYAPRLSIDAVRDIRARHLAGVSQKALRIEYGISKTLISQVVLRQIWRWA